MNATVQLFIVPSLVITSIGFAQPATEHNRAPNGRRELLQNSDSDWGPLILREVRSQRIIDRVFFRSPSGGNLPADRVHWSPNARGFAVECDDMRGPITAVYFISNRGAIHLQLPSPLSLQLTTHPPKWREGARDYPVGGTGFIKWLGDREFQVSYYHADCWDYIVTFRVSPTFSVEVVRMEDQLADR